MVYSMRTDWLTYLKIIINFQFIFLIMGKNLWTQSLELQNELNMNNDENNFKNILQKWISSP